MQFDYVVKAFADYPEPRISATLHFSALVRILNGLGAKAVKFPAFARIAYQTVTIGWPIDG